MAAPPVGSRCPTTVPSVRSFIFFFLFLFFRPQLFRSRMPRLMSLVRLLSGVLVALVALSLVSSASGASIGQRLRSRVALQPNQSPAHPFDRLPHMSMLDFHEQGQLPGDDAMSQVRTQCCTARREAGQRTVGDERDRRSC